VTKKKFKHLLQAADEYLFQNQHYKHVQFDVLSITMNHDRVAEYFLLEDVFL